MTIDESIKHCEQIAEDQGCTECGYEHRQLADWLRELKELKRNGMDSYPAGDVLPQNWRDELYKRLVGRRNV